MKQKIFIVSETHDKKMEARNLKEAEKICNSWRVNLYRHDAVVLVEYN